MNPFARRLALLVSDYGSTHPNAITAAQLMTAECLYMAAKLVAFGSTMPVDSFLQGARIAYEQATKDREKALAEGAVDTRH